jgi:four helix bundle protein
VATELEDLRILKTAENIADSIWKQVIQWDQFAKDVVGKQITRAADSIGANIAESYGRFNYGEKLQFMYYSRGSLFGTKYWLNRALVRDLMRADEVKSYGSQLSEVARQLNAFAASLKSQKKDNKPQPKSIRESITEYLIKEDPGPLFTDIEINQLEHNP